MKTTCASVLTDKSCCSKGYMFFMRHSLVKRTGKSLIRLRECAVRSESSLFAYVYAIKWRLLCPGLHVLPFLCQDMIYEQENKNQTHLQTLT